MIDLIESVSDAEELKKVIAFCEKIDFPTAVFDSSYMCVYSKNDLITVDSKIKQYLLPDYLLENEDFTTTIFIIKNNYYCAKILRVGSCYVCGLFNSHELGRMARNTDFFDRFLPNIDVFQYNMMHLWDIIPRLRNLGDYKNADDMEGYMTKINQIFQSFYEYFSMILKTPNHIRIDCYELLERMVKRCNTLLANCGRHIEFIGHYEHCHIAADRRHAICAFISAIQNSLLYSPKDTVPSVTIFKEKIDRKNYVTIKIVNENSYYAEKQKELYENDFSKHKIGCGVPIIRQFIEETGGKYELDQQNGKAVSLMHIPALKENKTDAIFFECGEFSRYETGIPDFFDLKINEVIELFKDDPF